MVFSARAAAPTLPGWLGSTSTKRVDVKPPRRSATAGSEEWWGWSTMKLGKVRNAYGSANAASALKCARAPRQNRAVGPWHAIPGSKRCRGSPDSGKIPIFAPGFLL
ncbi:hypothetical protein R69658_00536 [Paraburkholderia aspalathi]|uniref:Uncharacterized protein n=1 Tax=Paraburkholderia aspalathi TaxID=1324617 RepID=A0ABM8QL71_9BURK|nr:hypothetical protein R69658_00536 [Paraburkholderia aspalathi]